MLYVKKGKENSICYRLDPPVYVRRQENGVVVSIDSFTLAQGVLSPDHSQIWLLSGRPSLGEGYEEVEVITAAEYEAWESSLTAPDIQEPEIEDPEDTNPVIPETMDPKTVLTRAELTEKVMELDEALHMILSEEVEG